MVEVETGDAVAVKLVELFVKDPVIAELFRLTDDEVFDFVHRESVLRGDDDEAELSAINEGDYLFYLAKGRQRWLLKQSGFLE